GMDDRCLVRVPDASCLALRLVCARFGGGERRPCGLPCNAPTGAVSYAGPCGRDLHHGYTGTAHKTHTACLRRERRKTTSIPLLNRNSTVSRAHPSRSSSD